MNISIELLLLYSIAYVVGTFVGLWGIFKKVGCPQWHAIIPFYNLYAWLKVVERPMWWLIFLLIPYINIFTFMLLIWKTARMFDITRYIHLFPFVIFPFVGMPYVGFSKKMTFYTLDKVPEHELGIWDTRPLDKKQKIKGEQTNGGRIVKTKARGWSDAIIYAVAAAYIIRTFMFELYKIPTSSMESTLMVGDFLAVSKMTYGPKIPQTPIAVPFVHHTMPLTKYTKSYVQSVQFPFFRFPGRTNVQRNDAVVFNYPDGDTVVLERQSESYYAILRAIKNTFLHPEKYADQYYIVNNELHQYKELYSRYGKGYYSGKEYEVINKEYKVRYRPVDKRENYIKRCVGIPGDTLAIRNAILYVNGEKAYQPNQSQLMYIVQTNGMSLNENTRKKLNINEEDWQQIAPNMDAYHLYPEQVEKIKAMPFVLSIEPYITPDTIWEQDIFPYDIRYSWNRDNMGDFVVPKAGQTVKIDDSTIVLYARIIKNYEGNDLEIKGKKVYINGVECNEYTFKMNYYWMMGDNRHNSADSRYWGFVPENHIVGKASFVWLSLDKFKNWGEGKIRWNRMFRKIK